MSKPSHIYLDNNATTPLASSVVDAMRPFLEDAFANPSSPYTAGRACAAALVKARAAVASLIRARPSEIIFTSGGTESNNSAIHSALLSRPDRRHLVTSTVEHVSVLKFFKNLEPRGYLVTYLPVNRDGALNLDDARAAITSQTALVSIMTANNETGVLFPVSEIAAMARVRGALFHTDAVQAVGKIPFDASAIGADFASIGAHKMHGPKGVGALYLRDGAPFVPYLIGGDQENARRAGTENVPAIAGFGAAARLADEHLATAGADVRTLRDAAEKRIMTALEDVVVVGAVSPRLPNTSYLLIRGIESDALIARLDLDGLCCSSGSACAAGAHEPSHVLLAMGLPAAPGWGALRISLSRMTAPADMDYLVSRLSHSVHVLRGMT